MQIESAPIIFDAVLIQLVATAAMTGVIWIVQLVHYPMFAGLDEKTFLKWHEFHSSRISFIVVPLMACEMILSIYLSYELKSVWQYVVLACTLLIWGSTFLLSVPLHARLGLQRESGLIESLIRTNWPRTVAYSVKLVLTIVVLDVLVGLTQ